MSSHSLTVNIEDSILGQPTSVSLILTWKCGIGNSAEQALPLSPLLVSQRSGPPLAEFRSNSNATLVACFLLGFFIAFVERNDQGGRHCGYRAT